jgi:CubicO group peptidase (beta-lactamase class C family)
MQGYVERGDTNGILTLVARRGEVAHLASCGYKEVASKDPMGFDTIFRIYSMTKPIVSLALMMLYEQARFQLNDPVHKYLPEFKNIKVLEPNGAIVSPRQEISIHHLLTHTAGFTYGAFGDSEVDRLLMDADIFDKRITLEEMVHRIASLPLLYHPGERWVYSVATDVVGRLVEVLSGQSLADFLDEHIFKPLEMVDTAFSVPPGKLARLSTCYTETETEKIVVNDGVENSTYRHVNCYSGGGGLVSTLEDYFNFASLVSNRGTLNGTRLLGRKTLELMRTNHLPGKLLPMIIQEPILGYGFGLGFSVLLDVAQSQAQGSAGSHGWSGLASTTFWVDPVEDLIAILMTQYIALNPFPLQADFRSLVYQALVD